MIMCVAQTVPFVTHPQWALALSLTSLRTTTSPPCFHDIHLPAVELWGHFLFGGKREVVEAREWGEKLEETHSSPSPRERKSSFRQLTHTLTHCQVQQPLLVTPWHCSQRTCAHTPACLEQESFWDAEWVCVSITRHHLPCTLLYPVSNDLSIMHACNNMATITIDTLDLFELNSSFKKFFFFSFFICSLLERENGYISDWPQVKCEPQK